MPDTDSKQHTTSTQPVKKAGEKLGKKSGSPLAAVIGFSIVSAFIGGFLAIVFDPPQGWIRPEPTQRFWAPHTMPRTPDSSGLRLAMVHDVLHQRYAIPGKAWHRERIRRYLSDLKDIDFKAEAAPPLTVLKKIDDLAVSYDVLKQPDEGLAWLATQRDLLFQHFGPPPDPAPDRDIVLQKALELVSHDELDERLQAWYRHYANHGTLTVHKYLRDARQGDAEAIAGLRQGQQEVIQAVHIRPQAHFGRETWQIIAIEHVLASTEDPEWMTKFSLFGAPLQKWDEALRKRTKHADLVGRYSSYMGTRSSRWRAFEDLLKTGSPPSQSEEIDAVSRIPPPLQGNEWLSTLALEWMTKESLKLDTDEDFPWIHITHGFDQPTLAIMGMWMYGGGPNPHFALALGTMMEAINQRHLAYSAYTRALSMRERFSGNPEERDTLAAFCEQRRQLLADQIAAHENSLAPDLITKLDQRFEAELNRGSTYQTARAAYEDVAIAAGKDIFSNDFYADFNADYGTIASKPGKADFMLGRRVTRGFFPDGNWLLLWMSLCGGAGALLTGLAKRRHQMSDQRN